MRDKSYSWYENTFSTIIVLFTFAIAMAILLIIDNGNLSYDIIVEQELKINIPRDVHMLTAKLVLTFDFSISK